MNDRARGVYSVPDGVAWTCREEDGRPRIFVASLPHGPILVLEGSSAVIWEQAVEGGDAGLPERVARAVDEPLESVRDEVEVFVVQLVERGLLSGP